MNINEFLKIAFPVCHLRLRSRCAHVLAGAALTIAASATHAADVVEFYNVLLDNYFITADPNEAAAIDNGGAGPGWSRTGESFGSMGITPVCRFYGSITPGPNSHFYTASSVECDQLKQIQATTPATQKKWNFESLDFFTSSPINGVCPQNTVPVYRAYNNGFGRGIDSNHRITSNRAGIQQVLSRGWIDEGVVMCGSTVAYAASLTQAWLPLKGIWVVTSFSGSWPELLKIDTNTFMLATTITSPAGFEYGFWTYDPNSGRFYAVPAKDTNGAVGFSNRTEVEKNSSLRVENGQLVARRADGSEAARYQKLTNVPGGIVGAWGDPLQFVANNLFFFADGHYLLIDVKGSPICGPQGIEYGTYTFNDSTRDLAITAVNVDTDGCAGLYNGKLITYKAQLSADGNSLTLINPNDPAGTLGTSYGVRLTP